MTISPTELSLRYCRQRGWLAGVVERWIQQARRRVDLWGFVDLLVIMPMPRRRYSGVHYLHVQATTASNAAARVKKIRAHKNFMVVEDVGPIEVWAWAKQGARGQPKTWTLRRIDVSTDSWIADCAELLS